MASEPCTMLWLDFETTGLDIVCDDIIECAVFVTDPDGLVPRNYREWVIYPEKGFALWDPIVQEMHTSSGLYNECINDGILFPQFVDEFALYIYKQILEEDMVGSKLTVAGSGVGPFDLPIIKTQMESISTEYLNHYVMDVGVIGRFIRNCLEIDLPERPNVGHRAMDDIKDHYEEFLSYRKLMHRG